MSSSLPPWAPAFAGALTPPFSVRPELVEGRTGFILREAYQATRPSPARQQAHRRIALEQIEAHPRRLPALRIEAAVALHEQARVVMGGGE